MVVAVGTLLPGAGAGEGDGEGEGEGGGSGVELMVKATAFELTTLPVPLPSGLLTVTLTVPAVVRRLAGMVTASWLVLLMLLGVSVAVPNDTVAPGSKALPWMIRVKLGLPVTASVVFSEKMLGGWYSKAPTSTVPL